MLIKFTKAGLLALSLSLAVAACGGNNTGGTGGRGGSTSGTAGASGTTGSGGTSAGSGGSGTGAGGSAAGTSGGSGGATGGSAGGTGGTGGSAGGTGGSGTGGMPMTIEQCGTLGTAALINNCIINLPTDSVGQAVTFTMTVDYNTCKM
jgi:hypothetical protein